MADRDRVERLFSALCAFPWLVLAGPYVEAFVVRLVFSRWPRPMLDDPKQLATAPLHLVFQLLLLSLGVAIPLLVFVALWNYRKILRDWRHQLRIGVFAVGLVALWLLTNYDPGRVWDWFLD